MLSKEEIFIIKREKYLKNIRGFYDQDLIKKIIYVFHVMLFDYTSQKN